ncbi:MAG: ribosome maturation factor RimP [Desulfobulbaceae bacterium]|nr:ribosome maturation factor RimP [Desulfobulbaceae bacterium]
MSIVEEKIISGIESFVAPLLAEMGLELVEIQFRREGHGWVLRIYIDTERGVTLDDCAAVSRQVSAYLDVEDLIEYAYNLEVSSPGIERPLTKKNDFERFKGRKARIKLVEPLVEDQRVLTGVLIGLRGETVVLEIENEMVSLELANIKRARLSL